ncbi:MAG TPA: hypothetical protein PK566_15345 [Pseudobacteroides sp.]|jgi:ABC-2 type transport system permease protein|nr:hypothetical protein [Pseudobacteroides sp.]
MRTRALIKRIVLQMLRDKRTLGLLFVAPLVILTLMHFLFTDNTANYKLGIVNIDKMIATSLKDSSIIIQEVESASYETVLDEDLDGLLNNNNGKLELILLNDDPTVSKSLQLKVNIDYHTCWILCILFCFSHLGNRFIEGKNHRYFRTSYVNSYKES